ncbi:Pv-fam-d protein [Plasmodium cynomolgi strain B]|uniref:Pv-fam-d protein n=1 Tax=Plasmodium cynomolgi (strain B) TaxID=1120755 RepID=K6UFE7_PLACD|nr:Pv-fam-d protein [Plasmodium cynomolgi strain B]GAB69971.1 Pv-fam-d protein [Plasmodium cynomolgi strain B]
MNILDEDECTFEKRLKSLMQDYEFKKQFNTIRCNANVHNYDLFYDTSECIDSCDKLFDKIKNMMMKMENMITLTIVSRLKKNIICNIKLFKS